jgi:hypothetical protein
VHGLGAAVRAVADPEAPGLVVGRVRRGGELPIPLLRGEPGLDVVALCRCRAQLVRGDVHHAEREPELLRERLLDREQALVLVPGLLGGDEGEHLDLVELVDAEHAAGVAAGGPRLPAEVRRESRVAER